MNDCWLPMTAATLLLLLLTAAADPSSSYGGDDEYDEYDDSYAYVPPYGQRLPGRGQRPPPSPSFGRPRYTGIAVLHLDEGDRCRRRYRSEPEYMCMNANDCAGPMAEHLKYGHYLDVCSFNETRLVVCCPTVSDETSTRPTTTTAKSTRPTYATRPTTQQTPTTTSTKATRPTRPTRPTQPTTEATRPTTEATRRPYVTRPTTEETTTEEPTTTTTMTTSTTTTVRTRPPTRATRPPTKATRPPTRPTRPPTRATRPPTKATTAKPPTRATEPTTTTTIPAGEDTYQNANVAAEKCRQYNKLLPKSFYATPEVVSGTEAKPQEFPHMALLGYGNTTDIRDDWRCGGSLISERWILTAANCMYRRGSLARWVRLGDFDIESDTDLARPVDYRITKHVPHPDYKRTERYNDIALFQLEADVPFSAFVRPICLNVGPPPPDPTPQVVTGWGSISTDGAESDTLQKVTLDIVPPDMCNASYAANDDPQLKFGIMPDSMICGGAATEDEDACQGFSGGPLQTRDTRMDALTYTQFGITSFGSSFCGVKENPGVYTRVSKYVPWIESTVW